MKDFMKSRAGVVLLAFLGISGFLLVYEHRAHLFSGDAFTGNGVLLALLVGCIAMHLFMHGGHGGHGHGGRDHSDGEDEDGKKK